MNAEGSNRIRICGSVQGFAWKGGEKPCKPQFGSLVHWASTEPGTSKIQVYNFIH